MRRFLMRILAPLLIGLVVGCSPLSGSGCGSPPPRATDAAFYALGLQSHGPPCGYGPQAPRGSAPSLMVTLQCPGESEPFLVAVKIDGRLAGLVEVEGGGYSAYVSADAGPWDAPDTAWHQVEVVIDPLNLFAEADESNNRATAMVRIVEADIAVEAPFCGVTVVGGFSFVNTVPAGTEVFLHHRMICNGPFEAVVRSVSIGTTVAIADTLSFVSCTGLYPIIVPELYTRWTPPPGEYDIEFRVDPIRPATDGIPTNDAVTRHLTVTSTTTLRPLAAIRPPARGTAGR